MKREIKKGTFKKDNPSMLDACAIMGLGRFRIGKEYNVAHFSLEYLKKAVSIAETMQQDDLYFAVGKDFPIVIGNYDKKTKQMAGILLAPRVQH